MMTGMIRMMIGSVAGAIAMFIVGFLFWATPITSIAFRQAPDAAAITAQTALAQTLTTTGTGAYVIPSPSGSAANTILYARGPVATVHFSTEGFPTASSARLLAGFIHDLVVALIVGFALYGIGVRVTDFASRAQIVILFAIAGSALAHLGEPVRLHYDWIYSIFGFIADAIGLSVGGLVIARWFLPRPLG